MRNIVRIVGATAFAAIVAGAAIAPANAAPRAFIAGHAHSFARGGGAHWHGHYRGRSGYWGGNDWGPGYGYGYDPGSAIVGGLIGGVFGALADRALR